MKEPFKQLENAEQHLHKTGRPFVSVCFAQSLDGCLTAVPGQPTPLSGPESTLLTHQLRTAHDAILIGSGTALADNPRLTARLVEGPNPQPVILDRRLRTPLDSYLLETHPHQIWLAASQPAIETRGPAYQEKGARLLSIPQAPGGKLSLPALLDSLGREGIRSLMVEGGAQVITGFLLQKLINQMVITIAPLLTGGLHIGSGASPTSECGFPHLAPAKYRQFGDDMVVWGLVRQSTQG